MKTLAVSFGDGRYLDLARAALSRFGRLNNVPTMMLDILKLPAKMPHAAWAKAWIWELVPKDVERVIWIDADVVPVKPIMDLVPDFEVPFCGVLDHQRVGRQQAEWHNSAVIPLKHYFNAGVFVAHRQTAAMFEEWQGEMLKAPVVHWDQTPLNLLLGKHFSPGKLMVLPPVCNWLGSFGNVPREVRMVHFAGWVDQSARMNVLRLFSLLELGSAQEGQNERGAACVANW